MKVRCGDDDKLLDAVLARDSRAWRELVRRYEVGLRDAIREAVTGEHEITESDIDDVLGDFWLLLLEDDLRRLRGCRAADLGDWLAMMAGQLAVNTIGVPDDGGGGGVLRVQDGRWPPEGKDARAGEGVRPSWRRRADDVEAVGA